MLAIFSFSFLFCFFSLGCCCSFVNVEVFSKWKFYHLMLEESHLQQLQPILHIAKIETWEINSKKMQQKRTWIKMVLPKDTTVALFLLKTLIWVHHLCVSGITFFVQVQTWWRRSWSITSEARAASNQQSPNSPWFTSNLFYFRVLSLIFVEIKSIMIIRFFEMFHQLPVGAINKHMRGPAQLETMNHI